MTAAAHRLRISLVALFVLSSLFVTPPGPGAQPSGDLGIRQRVEAQAAIERVYHSHQIGASEPFEKAWTPALLKRRVRTRLRESLALATYWNAPVTGEALSAELRRIARDSRLPERLQEVYAALGNDRYLIEESFARGSLVDRLTRAYFANDRRIHGAAMAEAEDLRRQLAGSGLDPGSDHPRRTVQRIRRVGRNVAPDDAAGAGIAAAPVAGRDGAGEWVLEPVAFDETRSRAPRRIGSVGELEETPHAFVFRVLLDEGADSAEIASYVVPKKSWDEWWAEVENGLDERKVAPVSRARRGDPLPAPGSSIGFTEPEPDAVDGAAVAGVAGLAPPSPAAPAYCDLWNNGQLGSPEPDPREGHTAVWTGSLMIVWGGKISSPLATGGRYDPLTDTWTPTSLSGAPQARYNHSAVWTGTRMIVWGGICPGCSSNPTPSGAIYNPNLDSWSATDTTSASLPSGRSGHTASWVASQEMMVIYGGADSRGASLGDGARYELKSDTWGPMSATGAPGARQFHTAVSTGDLMVVWGGYGGSASSPTNTGAAYDPNKDAWSAPLPTSGAPSGRFLHTALWTGNRMIIWGGNTNGTSTGQVNTGGVYDPAGSRWSATSTTSPPAARQRHTAVWTGTRMIVWGGFGLGSTRLDTGGLYDPTLGWQPTSVTNAPSGREGHTAVWTGTRMIVWGGLDGKNAQASSGGRYDPSGDSWLPTSISNAPLGRTAHTAIWTGSLMIVWGGFTADSATNTGSRYDPMLDAWLGTSITASTPPARYRHTAVWTGNRMVVWGGDSGAGTFLITGGRYNPAQNTWQPTSTGGGVPTARSKHTAVWTGSEMIVWGGQNSNSPPISTLATGGRYSPVADAWASTPLLGAPPARTDHTAVWTGNRMLVWGGYTGALYLSSGDFYNPSTNAWAGSTNPVGAPTARSSHTAVWTGDLMVVWGGNNALGQLATGGRYDPSINTWFDTDPVAAPSGRTAHTAIWADIQMIVWGGSSGSAFLDSGAMYDPYNDLWTQTATAGAPLGRALHTAIWDGREMIVWGGQITASSGTSLLNGGGRYVPIDDTDSDGDGFTLCTGDCDDGNSEVYLGAPEECDNLDNDCEGTVDSFTSSCGVGECASTGTCTAGSDSCVPGPSTAEVCDNLDNDCDGTADEFTTTCGLGACEASGYCSAGLDDCTEGASTPELCDDVDNDCDGAVDNGDPGGGQACSTGQAGVCDAGTTECQAGGSLACVSAVQPSTESCDNLDNDCDGTVDDFVTSCGEGGCVSTGFCSGGVDSCIRQSPSPEICDDVDNDCNGSIDDGDPGGGAACTIPGGVGVCGFGTEHCAGGTLTCVPAGAATPETCNAADDNCDGQIDEGNPGGGAPCVTALPGVCAAGTTTCQFPGFTCVQNLQPSPEVCDNLDNNCDGVVDSFATTCGTGACARSGTCAAGVNSCAPGPPSAEMCDNVDNDCNGSVDGFTTSCGLGPCATTGSCTAGVDDCTPLPSSLETCNNADDDCDGQIDNGNPGGGAVCPTGLLGACGNGTITCQGGSFGCVQTSFPTAESCDNVDNDCDGTIDGQATTCGTGPCASTGSCAAGVDSCAAGTPSSEVCDGNDNDCDGNVDNLQGLDADLDFVDSGCDNCPAAYNPDQINTEGVGGGDACQVTVVYPLQGDVSCPSLPPTITWSPGQWTRFKVFISWDPGFHFRFTSGRKLLTTTQYTPPTEKWNLACTRAAPNLYIKVRGKKKGVTGKEESVPVQIQVK